MVDFGLSTINNTSTENKAVDLFVLEKSMIALMGVNRFEFVLLGYNCDEVVQRKLDEVRGRGRKK